MCGAQFDYLPSSSNLFICKTSGKLGKITIEQVETMDIKGFLFYKDLHSMKSLVSPIKGLTVILSLKIPNISPEKPMSAIT